MADRLEHEGVLACWAVPRGLPRDTGRNHLAVHTEDHPMQYLDFHGEIPAGEYGGGRMTIHDRGTYRCEKWQDDEVVVILDGERISGRYILFATGGKQGRDWMVRRTDPTPPGWTSMPELVRPMRPTPAARLPRDQANWGYELRWDGVRAMAYVSGGRLRLRDANDADITGAYPWLRELVDVPYAQRRELLDPLAPAGPHWQTPPWFPGTGAEALEAARQQGLPGVVAKRLDSVYEPGHASRRWLTIDVS